MATLSSQINRLVQIGQERLQPVPLLDFLGEDGARLIFTVGQHHAWFAGRDDAEPRQQIRLARVRAKSAERVHLGFHRDFLAEDAHFFFAVHQPPAQRAIALVADNEHVRVRLPQIGFEMMQDASSAAFSVRPKDATCGWE